MSFHAHVMAVDRVERRLRRVAAALDAAGIPYAVVGGNAVASWVGRVNPSATRATKDVDVMVRRADLPRITGVITALGFQREDLKDFVLFLDPDEPDRRAGVHLLWAGERIRPSHLVDAPGVTEALRDADGLLVLNLPALVRMKLTSFRRVDQVHIEDMLRVGLIDQAVRDALPPSLLERLREIESSMPEDFGA